MTMRTVWTETVFNRLVRDPDSLWQQILARVFFLCLVWLSGLLAYAADGMVLSYVADLQIAQGLFANGLIILFGANMLQRVLPGILESFRPLVKLDDASFGKLRESVLGLGGRVEPILVLCLVMTGLFTRALQDVAWMLGHGATLHSVWLVGFVFFLYFLVATGIWLGVSLWLLTFLVSRQPLNVELSSNIVERFRNLNSVALWFSLFYFMSLGIGGGLSLIGAPAFSFLELLLSPFLLFLLLGLVSVFFPFYNIHGTLVRLKRQQLEEIANEFQTLSRSLASSEGGQGGHSTEEMLRNLARLMMLQIREQSVKSAPEWPVDVGFVSRLMSLFLVPLMIRLVVEIINRRYFG